MIVDGYMKDRREEGIASPHTLEAHLKAIKTHFGHLLPESITKDTARAFRDARRKEGRSDGTIDKQIRSLRQALRWAVREKIIAEAPHVASPGRGEARKRFLSHAEGRALLEAADSEITAPHIRMFVHLALGTAQRMGAILELTWEQVDFEHGVIWFAGGSSKLKRRVAMPMSDGLRQALEEERQHARTEFVIEYQDAPVKSVKTGFHALLRRAGLSGVRVHDLRRTAASWSIMDGASFAQVAAMLGDDERTVKQHYAHFSPDYLAEMTGRLDPLKRGANAHYARRQKPANVEKSV